LSYGPFSLQDEITLTAS